MNDHQLETLLLVSRPHKTGKYSSFTDETMAKIRHGATFNKVARTTNTPTKWSVFMKYVSAHKAIAIIVAAVAVSLISFSGYAYASGTNPISLLKRWVTGEEVHVMYQGREFTHSKNYTYSDAAVTAFAELRTIDLLAYKAGIAYTVPKNGIEHVDNPYYHDHIYPWVGTVERLDGDKLIIRQQYSMGDKVKRAENLDTPLTIPLTDINTYVEGETAEANKLVGKLVVVHTQNYLRYRTGSKQTPEAVIHRFAFALNHTLDNIKEADQAWQPGADPLSPDNLPLYESSWSGAFSDRCGNNAADFCDPKLFMVGEGQSFYPCQENRSYGGPTCDNNPNAIPFGEAVPDSVARTAGIFLRDVEGKVWTMGDKNISIKTSSGQIWVLAFSTEQREAFSKRTRSVLKVGDRVGAAVISSVNDLDNRTFDDQHIYAMKRY